MSPAFTSCHGTELETSDRTGGWGKGGEQEGGGRRREGGHVEG